MKNANLIITSTLVLFLASHDICSSTIQNIMLDYIHPKFIWHVKWMFCDLLVYIYIYKQHEERFLAYVRLVRNPQEHEMFWMWLATLKVPYLTPFREAHNTNKPDLKPSAKATAVQR